MWTISIYLKASFEFRVWGFGFNADYVDPELETRNSKLETPDVGL
jgi:hypothetical protein